MKCRQQRAKRRQTRRQRCHCPTLGLSIKPDSQPSLGRSADTAVQHREASRAGAEGLSAGPDNVSKVSSTVHCSCSRAPFKSRPLEGESIANVSGFINNKSAKQHAVWVFLRLSLAGIPEVAYPLVITTKTTTKTTRIRVKPNASTMTRSRNSRSKDPVWSLISQNFANTNHPPPPSSTANLSLPLFFHVLIIATLSSLAVLSMSQTNYTRFRTTLLPLS